MVAKPKKLKNKRLDEFIESLYKKHGNNVEVDIFDIGKILDAGSEAYAGEEDPAIAENMADLAVRNAIAKYRKN